MEWKKRKKKDLEEWLPFLKENKVRLQSMGYSCILITYAVFPIDLLNIMDFLNDPNNIKTLKDNGISIETPSHTLEIEQLLREAVGEKEEERGSSFTSKEHLLLQELLQEPDNSKQTAQVFTFKEQVKDNDQKTGDTKNVPDTAISTVQTHDNEHIPETKFFLSKEHDNLQNLTRQMKVSSKESFRTRTGSIDSGLDSGYSL